MKIYTLAVALAFAFATPPAALAADEGQGQPGAQQQSAQAGAAHKLHGVVNSVNADAGRVNITHDPVESLKWPKMKMNFKVRDPVLLTDIKPGMTVDFELQKVGNEYYLTQITPVK